MSSRREWLWRRAAYRRLLESKWFWLVPVAAFFLFPNHRDLGSQILITGLFAVTLDLILGYAGIVSLGHAAFFGVGAYAAGLLAVGAVVWLLLRGDVRPTIEVVSRGVEITRFKGLGEISPGEFKAFIGKDLRLTSVNLSDASHIPEMLSFYMGRNTPVRRNYIMEHLRVESE
jgi:DNA gyrase/topoisomerase IV subunit B